MRVSCEVCQQVQPPYWQPGDLCVTCGSAVRREHRCYWCTHLTPAGNFCRHCGATQVPDEQYGAGRWLKHLGSDQFTIPERLQAFDSAQIEHFTRLYQRHAAVADRHIDDLALAESFTRHRGWARSLESSLLPLLPLPDAELAALTLPPRRGGSDAEQLTEIREVSPYQLTRILAALARLRLWQTQGELTRADVAPDLELLLSSVPPEGELGIEFALTLSHWRLSTPPGGLSLQQLTAAGLAVAAQGAFALEAVVNQGLFEVLRGRPQPIPLAALASEDPDLAFAAALAAPAPEPLLAALRVPARQYAAALLLTRMQLEFNALPILEALNEDEIGQILPYIRWQERPRPDLRPFLYRLATGKPVQPLITYARELLLLDLQPGDALPLLRANPWPDFINKLLVSPLLDPNDRLAVCQELVARGDFSTSRISGLTALIQADVLPIDFVPTTFATQTATSRQGLQALATWQLNRHTVQTLGPLVSFLRQLQWQPNHPDAYWAHSLLATWYAGSSDGHRPELNFPTAVATLYFTSYQAFIEEMVFILEHPEALRHLTSSYTFHSPLRAVRQITDPVLVNEPLAQLPPTLRLRLQAGLVSLVNDQGDFSAVQGALHLLNLMRRHAPWHATILHDFTQLSGSYYSDEVQRLLAQE
ncbi:zinc ribbon domain-containing protein [Hymenobacter norwichensis]|uniref:zinc ribbon domain-containing protein n=1 Tax=Hymenobacter norwichensis TaxID=223903 RepID=UPI0003B6112D|nr:zinc ribbon domain-containing protein [Hymenobacter norwichensis]